MGRVSQALKKLDTHPLLLRATRSVRHRLPGDVDYGDPLSVTGGEPNQLLAQRLNAAGGPAPSAMRELSLGTLQVWQAFSEAQGRGHGDEQLAILFTDLVGFSDWTLKAGDDHALELLRKVGSVEEAAVLRHRGRVVKRLGDGLMAVFPDVSGAVLAALEMAEGTTGIEVAGHNPQLRAGVHVGTPRKLGADYFGVDVNIAARVAQAAGPGEVLISEQVRQHLEQAGVETRRRWLFSAKGAPKGLKVYSASAESR